MSNRVNYGGTAANAAALMQAGARKVSDALDYEAVAPGVTLTAGADQIYLSNCPVLMFLTYGLRISVAEAGTGSVQVQVYAAGLPLFAAPVSITAETTLFPVADILPARQSIAAGARLTVRIVSLTGTGYSVWKGLRVAFLLRDPDGSLTTDALDVLTAQIVEAQQDADLANGSLKELAAGGVTLRRPGRDTVFYPPPANSDAGRMLALKAALQEAGLDINLPATIELLNGRFGIAAGAPLSSFLPAVPGTYDRGHVTVCFGVGASVLYADEKDATADWRLYPGNIRYAEQFGAVSGSTADAQPMLQAALFSMPPNPAPTKPVTKYPNIKVREGVLRLGAEHSISDTVWITSYQQIHGQSGRYSILFARQGFAPAGGPEKFMIDTSVYKDGVIEAPNFNFSIRVVGVHLASAHPTNVKCSGMQYGGAQGGEIDVIISLMGHRGLVLMGGTSHINVTTLCYAPTDTPDVWPQQTGPHISGSGLHSVNFITNSLERLNRFPDARLDYTIDGITDRLHCAMFTACSALTFGVTSGESNGYFMWFANCGRLDLGTVGHAGAGASGMGGTCVKLLNCSQFGWESIECAYFDKVYDIQGPDLLLVGPGDNAPFRAAGPMQVGGNLYQCDAGSLTIRRQDNVAPSAEGAGYTFKNSNTGGNSGLYILGGEGYRHSFLKHGASTGETGRQVSGGYNWVLDDGGNFGVFVRSKLKSVMGYAVEAAAVDPTVDDIADGCCLPWRNTVSGDQCLWFRNGATLTKIGPAA